MFFKKHLARFYLYHNKFHIFRTLWTIIKGIYEITIIKSRAKGQNIYKLFPSYPEKLFFVFFVLRKNNINTIACHFFLNQTPHWFGVNLAGSQIFF